jgi:precorrin-2 dehydrogenase/sirohydrochlorin ferrochelatase
MTVPLALDLSLLSVALVGAGNPLLKRLRLLDGEAVAGLCVYAPDPASEIIAACGDRLVARLPVDEEVAALRVLFVAGLPPADSAALAAQARRHKVLVNIEDDLPLCDFHVPAILRRGELALSISTGGASPTLSRRLRAHLEQLFPEDWSMRLDRIATLRRRLRAEGATPASVMEATEALIDQEGWLPKS